MTNLRRKRWQRGPCGSGEVLWRRVARRKQGRAALLRERRGRAGRRCEGAAPGLACPGQLALTPPGRGATVAGAYGATVAARSGAGGAISVARSGDNGSTQRGRRCYCGGLQRPRRASASGSRGCTASIGKRLPSPWTANGRPPCRALLRVRPRSPQISQLLSPPTTLPGLLC
jgi:hypothetical protein